MTKKKVEVVKVEPIALNKSSLIDNIAERADMTKVDATKALEAVVHSITAALETHGSVTLVGFGTFSVADRKERLGRNPKTKEQITIPASSTPKFKPGKALKDAVAKK